ncbi:MAG: hypothetical protein ACI4R6_01170, partial [Lachnospiraceae bacterium]
PENGITLYTRIGAEEKTSDIARYESYEVVNEPDSTNNQRSISFYDPVAANNGIPQGITVEQETDNGITTAKVTVKNLSMEPCSDGNLVVSLLNEKNQVLETKLYAQDAEHLISLAGEQSIAYTVSFASAGARVKADYFTVDSAEWQNHLATLSIDGAALLQTEGEVSGFVPEVKDYSATTLNMTSATVQAAAKSLNAVVTIQVLKSTDSGNVWYTAAEGTGAATAQIPLSYSNAEGEAAVNEVKVTVTPKDEQADVLNYVLHITSEHSESGTITLISDQALNSGWTNSEKISISTKAEGMTDFTPVISEYRTNQGEWAQAGTDSITNYVLDLKEDGKYVIEARMTDSAAYRRSAGELEIMVDRTAPVIDSEKLIFAETDEKLDDGKGSITRALYSVRSFLGLKLSNDEYKYKVQVEVPVWDGGMVMSADENPAVPTDTISGINSVSIVAGDR